MKFDPSLGVVSCCELPAEQHGVQCLAQGLFNMQIVGTANLAVKG